METRINRPTVLGRSVSLPERPKPASISSGDCSDKVVAKQTKRSVSVSFAPAPLDAAFEAPATSADAEAEAVAFEIPSISAVARNFGVLAKRYQDATSAERSAAFQTLAESGSRMFADFLSRDAKLDIDLAWDAKSHRAGARRAERPAGATILGQLANLSAGLSREASQVYGFAVARRTLLSAEMEQLLQCVAEQHDLVHDPALQGILVGCVLDGAVHALFTHDTLGAAMHDHAAYLRIKGSVLALCHAVEEVFSARYTREVRQILSKPALERANSWDAALVREPVSVIERCARTVSANPWRYSNKHFDKIEFQMSLRRTRNTGYGERRDPGI